MVAVMHPAAEAALATTARRLAEQHDRDVAVRARVGAELDQLRLDFADAIEAYRAGGDPAGVDQVLDVVRSARARLDALADEILQEVTSGG